MTARTEDWSASMSILGSILSKILPSSEANAAVVNAAASSSPAAASPSAAAAPAAAAPASSAKAAPAAQPAGQKVDVEAVLDGLDEKNSEELDWRHSIVDLMKLLNLDSSHAARIELAKELHYSGDTNNSAAMNVWLHEQVMQKLAENGGKVPADLIKH
jgi:3-oxoacyl-ACP reductase-like protein